MKNKLAIAIDGVVASGKGTLAKLVAERLGYIHIDSGSLYRAITVYMLDKSISVTDTKTIIDSLADIKIEFEKSEDLVSKKILLNGQDVSSRIREMVVSEHVSYVAAIPEVRHFVTGIQRSFASSGGIVIDGRDIGTVVLPDAELKIFLVADPEVRAKRRFKELQQKGETQVTYEEVLGNLRERDHLDSTREVSPLKQAEDGILLDSTNLTIPEVVDKVYNLAKDRL